MKNVGELTLPIVRELVAEIVLVDEAHLERAVNAYLTLQKTMAEGAGAAGLAAMLVEPERFRGRKVGLDPVRRQYRSAHPRLGHGARARARGPHRVVPPDHPGPARRARADRDPARRSSAPTSSRSTTGGCFSTCRPRAPSSTSRSRRATGRMPKRSCRARSRGLPAGADRYRDHDGVIHERHVLPRTGVA